MRIVPHGVLRETWPEGVELEASTAREAIHGYQAVVGLRPPPGGRWLVRVEGHETPQALVSPLETTELHIHPVFEGAGGNGSFIKIAIGVVLIATAILLGPAGWVAAGWGAGVLSAGIAGMTLGLGVSLVLGGVMELISPAPKMNSVGSIEQSEGSQYLGQPKNTTKVGTRIPIAIGRVKMYGHLLSFDVEADPRGIGDNAPNADQRRKTATYRVGYA